MKSRRGLSTVVGMVFAIIALTSTVAYVSYSMNTLGQFNSSTIVQNQQTIDTGKEKFQISNVQVVNNKFNITIVNTGSLPINITKLWVQNTTATDWTKSYTPVNNFVGPGATLKNIGQNIPLYYASTAPSYHFKLVTSRGNVQEFNLNSMGSQHLLTQFNAIPNQIPPSFTTTLVMTVTNNMTGNNYVINMQPQIIGLPAYTGSGTTQTVLLSQQTTAYPVLGPGNTAIFKWVYRASGTSGDTVKYTAGVIGDSNTYSDTVTLTDPLNSGFSANSLTSQGITCCRTYDNLIVLHQETMSTPSYGSPATPAYQMYEGSIDNTGKTITLQNENTQTQNNINFITQNDTVNQVDVQSGKWLLTMKYKSSSVPSTITTPDMIYLFNALSGNVPFDSTGCNGFTTTLGGTSGTTPLFNTTAQAARDGSGFFTFDGSKSQYVDIAKNSGGGGCHGNDLNNAKTTTTGWFKVAPSQKPAVKAVILRMEANQQNPKQWYEISMDNTGAISFNFFINNGSGQGTISCVTTGHNYADNNWHFFAAIRQSGEQCVLDMDGGPTYSTANGNQFTGGSNQHAGDKFNMDTDMFIGKSPTTTQQALYPFTGSIDNIIHWQTNSYLTDGSVALGAPNLVTDLYNKNYGTSAHSIIVTIYQADKNGNKYGTKNILNATTVALPYADSRGSSTFWQNFTYTTPILTNSSDAFQLWHFVPNTRLFLNVTWAGSATQHVEALPLSWRIDDPGTGDQYDSTLTVPNLNVPFPSYFTFSHNNAYVSFSVSNSGPNGLWITMAGTRLICQTMIAGGNSYAALLQAVNGTGGPPPAQNISPDTDSLYIALNKKAILTFNQLSTIPQQGGIPKGTSIVTGHYRMYAAILGYDDTGAQITKNFYIGVVNVT